MQVERERERFTLYVRCLHTRGFGFCRRESIQSYELPVALSQIIHFLQASNVLCNIQVWNHPFNKDKDET